MKYAGLGLLALLVSGCTSLVYNKTRTIYSDHVVEEVKISRVSLWQEVSFVIDTNGVAYNNDGGANSLTKATELLEAAGKLKP